jgi:CubicO group peptidase (beta-lactamase class C family)
MTYLDCLTNLFRQSISVLLGHVLLSVTAASATEAVFPGKQWQHKKPAEVGLDDAKLQDFSKKVGGRGCVVRHGYLVYTWGDAAKKADVASASKPIYAHFLLLALQLGKILSFDQQVHLWEPRLKELKKGPGQSDLEITWKHLANQTSCYGLTEKPGTAYCYNDWQMALFWDTLFLKVYGATYENVDEKVLRPLLAEPLQCQDQPTFLAFGVKDRPGRLAISPRDFARFGLLYLHKGKWQGKQLLDAKLAQMAISSPIPNTIPRAGTKAAPMIPGQRSIGSKVIPDNQTDHFGSYSWLWWINGTDAKGQRMWPDAPTDTFGAFGHGGQRALFVMPGLDLVVSYNDATLKEWTNGAKSPTNQAMKLLVQAVTK